MLMRLRAQNHGRKKHFSSCRRHRAQADFSRFEMIDLCRKTYIALVGFLAAKYVYLKELHCKRMSFSVVFSCQIDGARKLVELLGLRCLVPKR